MPCPIMTILKFSNFPSIDRVQAMKKVFVLELLRKFIVYITFSQLWDMLEVFYFKHTSKLSKCYCDLNILENLIINGSFVLISFCFPNIVLNFDFIFLSFIFSCFAVIVFIFLMIYKLAKWKWSEKKSSAFAPIS